MPSIVFSESELTNSRPGSTTDTNSGHNVTEHLTQNSQVRATFGRDSPSSLWRPTMGLNCRTKFDF